jgi:glutamine amidotransferase-like uncharacterized protein
MPTIALFMHQPYCNVQSGNGIMQALYPQYRFKIFPRQEIEADFFDDVDIVCFPGGTGDSDSFDSVMRHNRRLVMRYLRQGGRYLGICMGAYWADQDYFNIMNGVRVVQYIKQPGTDTRRPHAKHMPIWWDNTATGMYFYDGCTFSAGNYTTVARYATGWPMAIIQGRVGLIGCHPEAQRFWYDEYSWLQRHWSGGQQHLLQQFVQTLMEA